MYKKKNIYTPAVARSGNRFVVSRDLLMCGSRRTTPRGVDEHRGCGFPAIYGRPANLISPRNYFHGMAPVLHSPPPSPQLLNRSILHLKKQKDLAQELILIKNY